MPPVASLHQVTVSSVSIQQAPQGSHFHPNQAESQSVNASQLSMAPPLFGWNKILQPERPFANKTEDFAHLDELVLKTPMTSRP